MKDYETTIAATLPSHDDAPPLLVLSQNAGL